MSEIKKPVMIDTRDKNGHEMSKTIGWNQGIKQSDKYWEQELKKKELLRVELEMKLKDMEQELKPYKDKLEELQSRDCISLFTEQQICEYKDREWEQKLSVENIEKVLDIAYLKYHDCRSKFFTLEEKMLIKDLAEAINQLTKE